jgi:uncharacterized protein (TIGR02001 family)
MMKKTLVSIAVASMMTSVAQAEISANIGATSNYMWRGVSQTDDAAAIQGGVDFSAENGFYAGTWLSNIDFGSTTSDSKGAEVDVYLGFANELKNGWNYDVGAIRYIYPSTNHEDSDFTELYVNGGYKMFSAGIAYTVNGDPHEDSAFSKGDMYYHIGASFDLKDSWSLGVTLGKYDFDTAPVEDSVDYTHGQIDLTKSADKYGDFTLSFSKASFKTDPGSTSTLEDGKMFVTWTKSF